MIQEGVEMVRDCGSALADVGLAPRGIGAHQLLGYHVLRVVVAVEQLQDLGDHGVASALHLPEVARVRGAFEGPAKAAVQILRTRYQRSPERRLPTRRSS
jgi:hypothetical protein